MKYTKENYLTDLEKYKLEVRKIENVRESFRDLYIEDNKPCNIDDIVNITLNSGRVVKGKVLKFGILANYKVCITSFREWKDDKIKYITTPHLNVEIL